MKNILIPAGLILIILFQSACSTNKLLNRQQDRRTVREHTDTRSRQEENKQYSRSHSITDSTGQFYQVTIFPADSFEFSLREGFKGKASKVELRGSIQQLKRINDRSALIVSANSEATSKMNRKLAVKKLDHAKSVKKTGLGWWWLFVAVGLGLVMIWVSRRWRNML